MHFLTLEKCSSSSRGQKCIDSNAGRRSGPAQTPCCCLQRLESLKTAEACSSGRRWCHARDMACNCCLGRRSTVGGWTGTMVCGQWEGYCSGWARWSRSWRRGRGAGGLPRMSRCGRSHAGSVPWERGWWGSRSCCDAALHWTRRGMCWAYWRSSGRAPGYSGVRCCESGAHCRFEMTRYRCCRS